MIKVKINELENCERKIGKLKLHTNVKLCIGQKRVNS